MNDDVMKDEEGKRGSTRERRQKDVEQDHIYQIKLNLIIFMFKNFN